MTKQEKKQLEKANVLIVYRLPHNNEVRYWRHNYHWADQWETCTLKEWEFLQHVLGNLGIKVMLLDDTDHETEQAEIDKALDDL